MNWILVYPASSDGRTTIFKNKDLYKYILQNIKSNPLRFSSVIDRY